MFDQSTVQVHGQPGASAERVFDRQRKAWVKRNRRAFLLLDVIVAVVVVASLAAKLMWPWSGWYGGLVAGVALCFDLAMRLSPPSWITQWQTGAYGEQRTARTLGELPTGWAVLHDLPGRGGTNVDHVVVGPPGVFVLDTKNIGSELNIENDWLTVTRPDGLPGYRTDKPARSTKGAAAELSRTLTQASIRGWVHAVVVLWGDMPQEHVRGDRVDWVSGTKLASWLVAQPNPRRPVDVDRVVHALTAAR